MMEVTRVLGKWKLWLLFFLFMIINLYLFWQTQENTYATRASWSGTSRIEYLEEYERQLDMYRNLELGDALDDVRAKIDAYASSGVLQGYPLEENVRQNMVLPLLEYQDKYPSYLENVQENADRLGSISLFAREDAFSSRNIRMTASDFAKMKGTELQLGNYYGVSAFLEHSLTDYFVLLLIFYVVIIFVEERKKGFWGMIRVSKGGRLCLAGNRAGILAIFSIVVTVVLHLAVLGFSCHYFGKVPWEAAVQSIPYFQKLPVIWTVGEFIVQYFLRKALGMCLFAGIVWLLVSVIQNMTLALAVTGLVAVAEYLMFVFIPAPSVLNFFKYFNIFSLLDMGIFYGKYLNVNFLGYPVNARELVTGVLPFLLIGVFSSSILVNVLKRPEQQVGFWDRWYDHWLRVLDRMVSSLRGGWFEVYKWLFFQKGILVIGFLVVLLHEIYPVFDAERPQYRSMEEYYLEAWTGPIDDKVIQEKMLVEKESIDAEFAWYEGIQAQFERGEITFNELEIAGVLMEGVSNRLKAYHTVHDRVEQLKLVRNETEATPWLRNEMFYEELFGWENPEHQRKAGMIAIPFLVLLLSSVYSHERESVMSESLRPLKKGRGSLILYKQGITFFGTLLVWLLCYGADFISTTRVYPIYGWEAPIQSIPEMMSSNWNLSIGGFVLFVYGLRFLVLWTAAQVVVLVSCYRKKNQTSMILAAAVVVLPSILWMIGVEVLRDGTLSWYASVAEVMRQNDFSMRSILITYLGIFLAGMGFAVCSSVHWKNTKKRL